MGFALPLGVDALPVWKLAFCTRLRLGVAAHARWVRQLDAAAKVHESSEFVPAADSAADSA